MAAEFDKEIQAVIDKYSSFFESTTADVAISMRGQNIFYYMDSVSGEMYYVLEFKTAEQLEKIIQSEIADKILDLIDTGIEKLGKELTKLSDGIDDREYNRTIEHLAQSFELLQNEVSKSNAVISGFINGIKKD